MSYRNNNNIYFVTSLQIDSCTNTHLCLFASTFRLPLHQMKSDEQVSREPAFRLIQDFCRNSQNSLYKYEYVC